MGMFDYIVFNGKTYQTKDTPSQSIATYGIRDNELWFKDIVYEWNDDGEFGGYLEEVSHIWEFLGDFSGNICFYDYFKDKDGVYVSETWNALCMDGKILKLERVI
jgi:hypothetical protein